MSYSPDHVLGASYHSLVRADGLAVDTDDILRSLYGVSLGFV